MKPMKAFRRYFLLLTLALFPLLLPAADDLPSPQPGTLVHDYIGWLSASEKQQLDAKLIDFDNRSGTQIAVVIVDDLLGYEPNDYCTRLGVKWGVGGAEFSNGVILLVKPTGGQGERKTYIAVGYGLEPVIPDITALQIVNNELLPNFKQGNKYQGLDQATNVIMSLAEGEFPASEYGKSQGGKGSGWLIMLLFLLFFFGLPMLRAGQYSRVNNIGFWTAFWLLNRSTGKGTWGNFSGGSGGFGGGGGGGFGGFGGGSFGGGGAGGSW